MCRLCPGSTTPVTPTVTWYDLHLLPFGSNATGRLLAPGVRGSRAAYAGFAKALSGQGGPLFQRPVPSGQGFVDATRGRARSSQRRAEANTPPTPWFRDTAVLSYGPDYILSRGQ